MTKILAAVRLSAAITPKKASEIRVSDMKSRSQCWDAIDAIRSDYHNVVGGMKAWYSGGRTELTESAKKKVAALEAKAKTFPYEDDDD